jgi:hypothetical protein
MSVKNRRCLKLDWAIYLREIENRVFGGASLKAYETKNRPLPMAEAEFQFLLEKIEHPHWATREQAAKELASSSHPEASHALIQLLKDGNQKVCWTAMHGLISMRRLAVRPLLVELTRDFQSSCFLTAARHIFSELHKMGDLTDREVRVLNSLTHDHKGLTIAHMANEALISANTAR